jgi:hypothetical protein
MRDEKKLHPEESYYMIREETGIKLISKSFIKKKFKNLCFTMNFTKDGACTIISNILKIDLELIKEVCDEVDKELPFSCSFE